MKKFEVIKFSNMWSTTSLIEEVEYVLNQKSEEGYEIVSVAFGVNLWWMPTAFITIRG